jgi:hypothetical protein
MKSFLEFILAWVSSFVTGLCLAIMWKWFITPLGVPAISVIHAVGLCFIVGVLFGKKDPKAKIDVEKILYAMLYDGIGLLFSFLVHLAM